MLPRYGLVTQHDRSSKLHVLDWSSPRVSTSDLRRRTSDKKKEAVLREARAPPRGAAIVEDDNKGWRGGTSKKSTEKENRFERGLIIHKFELEGGPSVVEIP